MATLNEGSTNEVAQPGLFHAYHKALLTLFRSPAAWLFTALFLVGNIYLILAGLPKLILLGLYSLAFLLLTALIVIPLTPRTPTPAWEEPATYSRTRLWWQVVLIFLIIIAIALMVFQPLFLGPITPLERVLYYMLEIVFPVGGMLLLGANLRELGFGRGYRTWSVALVLIIVPVILMIIGIILQKLPLVYFLIAPITYLISAGLPEEIGMRGVMMTRLVRISNVPWGIVLSSLIFGLIHVGANPGFFHTDIPASIALAITFQATLGIALAFVLQRTRNLVAGMVYHSFIDAANFILLPLVLGFLLQH
jgi:membrane protease YdiL (CAAX protease family)